MNTTNVFTPYNVIENEARRLYYKHMKLNAELYTYMWLQCSKEYRNAWRLIAKVNL